MDLQRSVLIAPCTVYMYACLIYNHTIFMSTIQYFYLYTLVFVHIHSMLLTVCVQQ